jgi:hypothetical protein
LTEPPREEASPDEPVRTAVKVRGAPEPGLLSLIAATLVLLIAVGVVLWSASSAPYGRSVVVTIRNP